MRMSGSVVLEPFFDVIEHVHGYCVDAGDFALVVLKDENHVEVFQLKLNTFEVNQFKIFQRYDKRRLQYTIYSLN